MNGCVNSVVFAMNQEQALPEWESFPEGQTTQFTKKRLAPTHTNGSLQGSTFVYYKYFPHNVNQKKGGYHRPWLYFLGVFLSFASCNNVFDTFD
jgi:hypothetical protein